MSVLDLRDAFEKKLGAKLRDLANSADEAVLLRVDRWVEAVTGAFRDLGKASGLEVAPIRRGVGELGWELVWGENLAPAYAQLGSVPPAKLFRLELVLEISENTLRPGTRPESAVEEACADMAKLLWARARTKVLVFGAHREKEPASSLEALDAGLTGLIGERDKEAEWLLVALPNLQEGHTVTGAQATLWTRIVRAGRPEAPRQVALSELLRGQ